MFNPSRQEVREFFINTWQKQLQRLPLTQLETIAADWIVEHPEYHSQLILTPEQIEANYFPEQGQTNPFLHLSMHLAITEQISIDQPTGIRSIFKKLSAKYDSPHQAQHAMIECLAEVVWQAQKNHQPINQENYLENLKNLL